MAVTSTILKEFNNPATIAKSFEKRTPVKPTLLEWMLPESKRHDHLFPVITMELLNHVLRNVPHSGRGVEGFAIDGNSFDFKDFEPKPIIQVRNISAKDLNDLKVIYGQDTKAQFISKYTCVIRDQTLLTINAMLVSFLSGSGTMTITKNTPMGMVTETFEFGTLPSVTTSVKWDDAAAKISDVQKTLDDMHSKLATSGYGDTGMEVRCGKDAWIALIKLVEAYVSTSKEGIDGVVELGPGRAHADINGYIVKPVTETCSAYSAAGVISSISMMDPDIVYGKAVDDRNEMYYCSLDRTDGQENSRLAIDTESKKRVVIMEGESKPFPILDVNSFVQSDVML